MELEHQFTVPASVEETWAAFNDPEVVAPCFPGATLISVDGDQFTGSAKIKLGPIAMQYNGIGTYVQRDVQARRAVIEATGRDKRGNGTASAKVTAQLTADGDGTAVQVTTDLAVTGKPAQFGRGVMQDVSDKLLEQFVACLQVKLGSPNTASTSAGLAPVAEVAPAPKVASTPLVDVPHPDILGGAGASSAPGTPNRLPPAPAPRVDDELHLLSTVGRVLLTRYAARALGPVAFIVGYLLGRRSRH
ncbi:MAG: SRPBCC family protein [Actinomycetota bacterium]